MIIIIIYIIIWMCFPRLPLGFVQRTHRASQWMQDMLCSSPRSSVKHTRVLHLSVFFSRPLASSLGDINNTAEWHLCRQRLHDGVATSNGANRLLTFCANKRCHTDLLVTGDKNGHWYTLVRWCHKAIGFLIEHYAIHLWDKRDRARDHVR